MFPIFLSTNCFYVLTLFFRLIVLETYLNLHDNLVRVVKRCAREHNLAPPLLCIDSELKIVADVVIILREVRRVGRALEAETTVSASRAPFLLWQLYETLRSWATFVKPTADSCASSTASDKAVQSARETLLRTEVL